MKWLALLLTLEDNRTSSYVLCVPIRTYATSTALAVVRDVQYRELNDFALNMNHVFRVSKVLIQWGHEGMCRKK